MTDDRESGLGKRLGNDEEQQRRLRAAALFARGLPQAEVARMLGVSRMAVSRWHRLWKARGTRPLLGAETRGSRPKLTDAQIARLEPKLRISPVASGFDGDRWTLALIVELIRREYGVLYHPSQVRKILNALGWFHRPSGRPKRGAKTGHGPFAWRHSGRVRGRGRREFKPADK